MANAVKTGATIGAGVIGAGLGAAAASQFLPQSDPLLRTAVNIGGTLAGAAGAVWLLWTFWPAAKSSA